MNKSDEIKEAAAAAHSQMKDGENPAKVFAELYKKFTEDFELVVEEIARFDLKEEHFEQFKVAQTKYISVKQRLGGTYVIFYSKYILPCFYINCRTLHQKRPALPISSKGFGMFQRRKDEVVTAC